MCLSRAAQHSGSCSSGLLAAKGPDVPEPLASAEYSLSLLILYNQRRERIVRVVVCCLMLPPLWPSEREEEEKSSEAEAACDAVPKQTHWCW